MAVKRSREKVLTRAQAVVPVAATGAFLPTSDDTEGGAIGVFLVDEDGVPYSAGGGTITVEADATAAAPSYAEGTANPLSMDLSGALRVTGSISASTTATATAAAPSYVEGDPEPLSQNLTGDLRVIAKQGGSWTVAATIADGADATQGDVSDAAYTGTGDMTLVAGIKTIANEMLSTDPAAVNAVPSAPYYNASVSTAKYLVSNVPVVLTDYYVTNPHAADVLSILIYDASSTGGVTVGTTPPARQLALKGGQSANVGAMALNFSVGIVIAAIKDYTGTTAPTTAAIVSLGYRAP